MDLLAAAAAAEAAAAEEALFRGNVPSAAEWKRAWADLSETVSSRKIGRLERKRAAPGAATSINENRERKRSRRQLCVMAEVVRRDIREQLRLATSITLAFDESRYRKIVRYRADAPYVPPGTRPLAGGLRPSSTGAAGF